MTRIFLIQHGQVAGNAGDDRAFAGWNDLPLTPHGLAQAAAVARRLADETIDAVYSSDLQRASGTAQAICVAHGLPNRPDRAFREVNYGEWEGIAESEVARRWPELWHRRVADPFNVSPPGGESYAALWLRMRPAWEAVLQSHPDGTVVIVGHNGSLRVLLCELLGTPLQYARRLELANCGLSTVHVSVAGAEATVIETVNETCHLRGI